MANDRIKITLHLEPALAAEVTAFVRDRITQSRGPRTPMSTTAPPMVLETGVNGDPWQPTSYAVLRRRQEQSYVRVQKLLDVLSAQPDLGLTPEEAAASTGYQASELRQALGRLTTLMKSHTDEQNWPLIWDGTHRQWSMSRAQADAWLASAQPI